MERASGLAILQKTRDALNARGAKTIRGLGRVFRNFDSFNGDKKIDADEFFTGLKEIGVRLTKTESDALLRLLDKNGDGMIDYEEFLVGIRGKMNSRRQAVTDKCFLKFDKNFSGAIDANDLRGVYDVSFHPKVRSGELTENDVFLEFLSNFGDTNKDGTITKDEWDEYYHAVSASIDDDDHFIQLMIKCWGLDAK